MRAQDFFPRLPLGWAPDVGRASVLFPAQPASPLGWPGVALLAVLTAPVMPFLIAGMDRAGPEGVPHSHLLSHGRLLLCSLPLLAFVFVLKGAPWALMLVLGHLGWLLGLLICAWSLWQLTRPGDRLRQRVKADMTVVLALAGGLTALSALVPDMLWVWSVHAQDYAGFLQVLLPLYGVALLAGATTIGRTLRRLLEQFRPSVLYTTPRTADARAATMGLTVRCTPLGLRLSGTRDGARILLLLDEAHAPPRLFVEVLDPALPSALVLATRSRASADSSPLSDPVLRGTVAVSGVPAGAADALLADAHETVMSIFHAHPDAHLEEQALRFSLPCEADSLSALEATLEAATQQALRLVTLLRARTAAGADRTASRHPQGHEISR